MQIYLVGGAVRDRLLGLEVKDRDWVVVGATPEEMGAQGFKAVGSDFPVFLHPKTSEEYALARTERKSGKGYTGFTFHTSPDVTLEQDLLRRDLTINAIAEDLDGQLHDPCGGLADLDARLLRHVSPAFTEDPLRVLRVARFYARFAHLGFTLAPETEQLLKEISASDELEHLTPERVWQECERALSTQSPACFFNLLQMVGALEKVMPGAEQYNPNRFQLLTEASADLDSEQCFALFAVSLTENESLDSAQESIRALCRHWRIPNRFKDLAMQVRGSLEALAHMSQIDAAARLEALKAFSLLRQPERLTRLLPLIARLYPRCSRKQLAHGIQAVLAEIAAIDNRAIQAEGYTGKALGEAIQQRQLECCCRYQEPEA